VGLGAKPMHPKHASRKQTDWIIDTDGTCNMKSFKGTLRRRIAYIFFGPPGKYIL